MLAGALRAAQQGPQALGDPRELTADPWGTKHGCHVGQQTEQGTQRPQTRRRKLGDGGEVGALSAHHVAG